MKRIVLTGGGTAGHVTPNIALIARLKKEGWDIHYIGTYQGIEKGLIEQTGIPYHGISSGKLRRYFDVKNLTDPFRVLWGMKEATALVKKLKPNVIFSKGGFVAVPVILGGWINRVPTIIHESDMTPGLANKLAIPFASKICANFPETLQYLPKDKGILTGTPIRQEIFKGSGQRGRDLCGFDAQKPVILVMGGSLGSVKINTCVRSALPILLEPFQIIHLCGKGNIDETLQGIKGYKQFEYVSEELPDLFASSDLVISRAGANSISEFLALKKPHVLIPLSAKASRGDQILNALSFENQGFGKVLLEEDMEVETLIQTVIDVYKNRHAYIHTMDQSKVADGIEEVMKLLREYQS